MKAIAVRSCGLSFSEVYTSILRAWEVGLRREFWGFESQNLGARALGENWEVGVEGSQGLRFWAVAWGLE